MTTVSEALAQAVEDHRAGRLQEAERLYRQILAVAPNHSDAWHLLGVIAHQMGKHDIAIDYITRAIQLDGSVAAMHNNLGEAYRLSNHIPEARACYQAAVQLKLDYFEAHNNLGIVLFKEGKAAEAAGSFRRALELNAHYAEAYSNLGLVLKDQGQFTEAIASFRQALKLRPDFADAHNNLGVTFKAQGEVAQAIACYRRALQLQANSAEVHNNLGTALMELGQADEAITCFDQALRLQPNFAVAHNNLGMAFRELGQTADAKACFQTAVQLDPDFAAAHNNLGNTLWEEKNATEAIASFEQALRINPSLAEPLINLGGAYELQGRFADAISCSRRALEQEPQRLAALYRLVHNLQHICDWTELKTLAQQVVDAVDKGVSLKPGDRVPALSFVSLPIVTTPHQQMQCAIRWASRMPVAPNCPRPRNPSAARSNSKITLGYLSADYHEHATAYLIAELFEKHDRGRFAVHAYSIGPDGDSPMHRRLVKGVDRFVELRDAPFLQAAHRIADDGVDILIDLKGYTQNARTRIAALRPAPIQVNYLGYPGTMGAPFIDYILVDDFVVPSDQQPFFTERLVHLPGCYQINDSQRKIAHQTPSRTECGLPERGVVFCSFNNNFKITPDMFDVWMQVLQAVPESVLWLLEGNRFAPDNLRREAKARGVEADRLVFAPRQELPEHLARHRLADLFLDTFPYNAHTTASDSLWACCPVLTLAGETFASRVAGSLLRTLDLRELITTSFKDYHDLALRLAQDRPFLAELQARLQANRLTCGLFEGEQFARNVEKAYLKMWEIHSGGEKPRAFAVESL